MTNTNLQDNPFTPTQGYQSSHDIPVDGFGITVETMNYWLANHELSLFPKNATAQAIISDEHLNVNADYENQADDLFDILSEFENDGQISDAYPDVTVYNGCNINLHCYLIWHGDIDKLTDLQNALIEAYQIPMELQANFKKFIANYADDIIACDYC